MLAEHDVQRRLSAALQTYASALVPGLGNDEVWRTHTIAIIPDNRAGSGFTVKVHRNGNPNDEAGRFIITVSARKIAHASTTSADSTALTASTPTAETSTQYEWIEGTWGPQRLAGVLNYGRTPVAGDIMRGPDGNEWKVLVALDLRNPDTIKIETIPSGRTFESKPPQGWGTPVTFRRGRNGTATAMLATHLGATPVAGGE